MQIRNWLIVLAVIPVLVLAGCGGSSSNSNGSNGPVLQSISVSGGASSIKVGSTTQFSATGHYSDGSMKALGSGVAWSSSNSAVASIDSTGKATGLAAGSTNISASFSGKNSTAAALAVNSVNLSSITVSASSSQVFVGSQLQFTATGHYDDGTTKDLSPSVTWASSDNSKATIASSGLATGVHGGQVNVTATSGAVSGSASLTITALLSRISISPIGPGIVIGSNQQFAATGAYNDGTMLDITNSVSWSSSDSTKASITSSGLATGTGVGAITIGTSGTSPDGSTVAAATALNVVQTPAIPPNLNGSYAFTLISADTRGPQLFMGDIVADGSGNLTGVEDSNTAAGVRQNVSFTGTYSVYPDGRGTIKINPNAVQANGMTLRFILAPGGTSGRLIQFDGLGTAKGSFEIQDTSAFNTASISGNYVFRASGIDSSANPVGQVGVFAAAGGTISGGTVDMDDFGTVTTLVPMNASSYTVGANGRGTLQLATASGVANFALYVVNSSKITFIQLDAASNTSLSGQAELQSNQTFSAADLSGGYAFLLDRPVVVGNGNFDRREFGQVGEYTFDGVSSMIGTRDDTNNGTLNPLIGITGSFAVGGTGVNGRGTLNAQASTGFRGYIFYMVSPQKMYVLHAYNGSTSATSLNAPTGEAEQQTGKPYSLNSFTGTHLLDASDLTVTYVEVLMQITFNGSGAINGIADLSANGAVSSVAFTANYSAFTPGPDPDTGRGAITLPSPVGAQNYIFYIVSPQNAYVLGLTPPAIGGINF